MDNKRNRLIQRYLCPEKCFWNPQVCFLDKSHSGNLAHLMRKAFHDNFNPDFEAQFNKNNSLKLDWTLSGGLLGYFPSQGLNNLIEGLGITSDLSYDDQGCAINFDNLSRKFWDSDPVRPVYIMEEKKCHDMIEAMINVNKDNIEANRNKMQRIYDESVHASGPLREPILSLMMWGPAAEFGMNTTEQKCDLNHSNSGRHTCRNFQEKHYWMYCHGDQVECNLGPVGNLSGPPMTLNMKVIYPCNKSACNQDCLCPFCLLSQRCPTDQHKRHIKDFDQGCIAQKASQCQEHWVKHPGNYDEKEDIVVEKNIYYHNKVLVKKPRKYAAQKLTFAGIPIKCKTCCKNVETHFKQHKAIHLQCKFCLHQLRTAVDKNFWDTVCNICSKVFPDITTRQMYFHKKTHTSDWACDDCEIKFSRKWTLRRHLVEIHGLHPHELDVEDETEDQDESSEIDSDTSEDEIKVNLNCTFCGKEFKLQRYLDNHIKDNHQSQSFTCSVCPSKFNQKKNLKRHEETVHSKHPEDVVNFTGEKKTFACLVCSEEFTRMDNLERHIREHTQLTQKLACEICGKNYSRKENLQEHINLVHLHKETKFICRYCKKEFDRKRTLTRHEKNCTDKIK